MDTSKWAKIKLPHDKQIWQNRYGHLAMKTAAGTWKLISLAEADTRFDIPIGIKLKAAMGILGLTAIDIEKITGITRNSLHNWVENKHRPQRAGALLIEAMIIEPALRLEAGEEHF